MKVQQIFCTQNIMYLEHSTGAEILFFFFFFVVVVFKFYFIFLRGEGAGGENWWDKAVDYEMDL